MTEEQWRPCNDPEMMLEFVRNEVSDRKVRLFAVACCRNIWECCTYPPARQAVEMAERYADGVITLRALIDAGYSMGHPNGWPHETETARRASFAFANSAAHPCKDHGEATLFAALHTAKDAREVRPTAGPAEASAQAGLLRCIVGPLPFRPIVPDPSWLAWDGGTPLRIAQAIYPERAFDHFPVLADALEEAGCTSIDLLSHLRSPGPHVRGCWALDLILAKS